jgi:hypothetical protein
MVSPVLGPPTLAASLDAFYLEHRLCGELEGLVEERPEGASRVARGALLKTRMPGKAGKETG